MRIRSLPLVLAVAAALAGAGPAHATGWAEPERISAPGSMLDDRADAGAGLLTAAGETVLQWKELTADRFGTLRAHVRSDGDAATTDLATNVDYHDLAQAGDGTVVSAWVTLPGAPSQYVAGHVEVAVRPPHGAFGAPVRLASGNWADVAVAANADGDLAVLWGFESTLGVSVRPAGGTWSAPHVVPGVSRGSSFDVALTPEGDAIVAGARIEPGESGYGDLAVTTRFADGTFAPAQVYEANVLKISVLADAQGGAAVLWRDDTHGRIVFRQADGSFGPFHHTLVSSYWRDFAEPVITPAGDILFVQDGTTAPYHEPGVWLVRASTAARTVEAPRKLGGEGRTAAAVAVRDDGTALLTWTDYDYNTARVLHPDGTLGPQQAVTCTTPTGATTLPLGLAPGGQGVLALTQDRDLVHEPGLLLTTQEPGREPLAECRWDRRIVVTPQVGPPGPRVIDVSRTADRRFSANWWRFDLDDNGTFETVSHDGVVEADIARSSHIEFWHCSGPVPEEERACGGTYPVTVWVQEPGTLGPMQPPPDGLRPLPIGGWTSEPPPDTPQPAPPGDERPPDPAEEAPSGLFVAVAPSADLRQTLRHGVPVTLSSRSSGRVRMELRSPALGRAGLRTVAVRAGVPRRVAVAVRRPVARRLRRARETTLVLRVTGAGVEHRAAIRLRARRR